MSASSRRATRRRNQFASDFAIGMLIGFCALSVLAVVWAIGASL